MPDRDIHDQAADDFAARASDLPKDRALALAAEVLAQWWGGNAPSAALWLLAEAEHDRMANVAENDPGACGMCGGDGCASCKMTGRAALDDELQGRR
jgi:hypothetical protein